MQFALRATCALCFFFFYIYINRHVQNCTHWPLEKYHQKTRDVLWQIRSTRLAKPANPTWKNWRAEPQRLANSASWWVELPSWPVGCCCSPPAGTADCIWPTRKRLWTGKDKSRFHPRFDLVPSTTETHFPSCSCSVCWLVIVKSLPGALTAREPVLVGDLCPIMPAITDCLTFWGWQK